MAQFACGMCPRAAVARQAEVRAREGELRSRLKVRLPLVPKFVRSRCVVCCSCTAVLRGVCAWEGFPGAGFWCVHMQVRMGVSVFISVFIGTLVCG